MAVELAAFVGMCVGLAVGLRWYVWKRGETPSRCTCATVTERFVNDGCEEHGLEVTKLLAETEAKP